MLASIVTALAVVPACTPLRPLDDDRTDAFAASARDAGASDASRDAPVPDVGVTDAAPDAAFDAAGLDAFAPDAYTPDAFVPRDAFRAPDAWVSMSPVRPSAPGSLVFSELMIDPAGGEPDEWVELYNPSAAQAYDLRGCSFDGMATTHEIERAFVISPRAYGTAVASAEPEFTPDYVYGVREFLLEDAADRVALVCDGVVIDEVLYNRTFSILERRSIMVESSVLGGMSPHLGNDVASAWCSAPDTSRYSLQGYGTPGEMNNCPP